MAWLHRGGERQQAWQPAVNTRGYLATSDLPLLLDNGAHVLYLDAYTATTRTFTTWTRALEVPDFRSSVVVTPSFPALLPVPEHAEFTHHGALGPTADQWPTVAVAHLAAAGGPELLSMDGWDVDGRRRYKARDEFGCTVMDWRGMVYTPTT